MAFEVRLFTFAKRLNSTKRPVLEDGDVYSCVLKDTTDMLSPQLLFTFSSGFAPSNLNYAYIPSFFSRYYWIDTWTQDKGQWIASCRVDALATWRNMIGESSQYVLRSSELFNGNITDAWYANTRETRCVRNTHTMYTWPGYDGGYIVVGIVNGDSNAIGGVSYYRFTPEGYSRFNNTILSSVEYLGITDISQELVKALVNPYQYITTLMWFPIEPPTVGVDLQIVRLGYWSFNVEGMGCQALTNSYSVSDFTVDYPQHPSAQTVGAYLNNAPFAAYTVQLDPFGNIQLPPSATPQGNNAILHVRIAYDFITGQCVAWLDQKADVAFDHPQTPLIQVYGQIGVPLSISAVTRDYAGAVSSAASALTGVAGLIGGVAGKDFGAASQGAIAATSGILGAVESWAGSNMSSGGNGSFAALASDHWGVCNLIGNFVMTTLRDNADFGSPICEPVVLDTIPGFIMCQNAHIAIPGTPAETAEIETAMNGGFYFE